MSNLAPAAQNKLNSVRDLFMSCQKQIAAALPKHMTPERMARIAFSAAQRNPKLLECTPQSLALSVINASELGCEPGLSGEAYLIPYKTTCTLIIGYKGLMKLARNSGMVKSFQVGVVRQGDMFEYERGSGKFLKHKESGDNEEAPITHVWAGAMVEGEFEFEVMTIGQIEKVKKRSRSASDGPWVTDYEEMCKKTVIRRFCKLLPASAELSKAVALDEHGEAGLPQASDIVDLGAAEEVEDPRSAASKAKKALGIQTPAQPVQAPPERAEEPSEAFAAWHAGLSDEDRSTYNEAYKAARGEGLEVEDAHVAGLTKIQH